MTTLDSICISYFHNLNSASYYFIKKIIPILNHTKHDYTNETSHNEMNPNIALKDSLFFFIPLFSLQNRRRAELRRPNNEETIYKLPELITDVLLIFFHFLAYENSYAQEACR